MLQEQVARLFATRLGSMERAVARVLYVFLLLGVILAWSALAVLGTVDVRAANRAITSIEAVAGEAVSTGWWSQAGHEALALAGLENRAVDGRTDGTAID